ncbi:hypothetical protein SARC_09098 [Sphaeroforma arctica JP610]|uniref:Uncharacterized protein n=1 Tax=Sphaeroforma arctica JP610 TaxID=667725 RepID=A0A0L0FNR8_9EUKA|nr:hypothetical protein SARC_09098 [Sphaeroforma arctica JP610]KNC78472.1 hypothetical protein SARC_09098 [Sphaeroforma arctica JP610]|eukprot:XP_014152374.1 hypothetical protein SARC_09098 [Sphaeroforma arctica JP610]
MVQISATAESMFFFNPEISNDSDPRRQVPVQSPMVQRRNNQTPTNLASPVDTMVYWMAKGGLQDII